MGEGGRKGIIAAQCGESHSRGHCGRCREQKKELLRQLIVEEVAWVGSEGLGRRGR